MAEKPVKGNIIPRLLAWLKSEGIEPDEMILRHVLGIAKSLETKTTEKR